MRTSRIARDTSKILALSTRTTRQTRAATAIQNVALDGAGDGNAKTEIEEEARREIRVESSESELSSVPEDVGSDGSEEVTVRTTHTRKRKREQDGTTPRTTASRRIRETVIPEPLPADQTTKPKKVRRAPAKKTTTASGTVKLEPPPHWEEIYSLTRQMRSTKLAPVDTMGCESLADRTATPRDQRFQTLISLMLSSQTKDTVISVAIKGMQERMPGGFNLESVLKMEPAELNGFINKVGFHNLKTKYIKQTAEILRENWNSDIPDTIEGLTSLPGVGPKMAYLCMSAAWGRTEGIGVDVHVHRITNLWGWHKTKTPEETRKSLESWLPREKWHDINNLLVGFGQTVCLPVGRKCGECRLAEKGLCPSAVVGKEKRVKEEVVVKEEDGEGEIVVKKDVDVVVENEIKAEDVEEHNIKVEEVDNDIPDIEDIGKLSV